MTAMESAHVNVRQRIGFQQVSSFLLFLQSASDAMKHQPKRAAGRRTEAESADGCGLESDLRRMGGGDPLCSHLTKTPGLPAEVSSQDEWKNSPRQ